MTHIPLTDEQTERLDGVVERALGDDFAKRVLKKIEEDIVYQVQMAIEYELIESMKLNIADEATRAAAAFIEDLARGDEKAILEFIGDPPGYQNWQREHLGRWGDEGSPSSPAALRKAMIEVCGEQLKTERILDLETTVEHLRTELSKVKAELHESRMIDQARWSREGER